MSSLYLRYKLHLREPEITFLGMIATFSENISLECIQQKFRSHFNKSIKTKTIIDYFNCIKVRVNVDYDLRFTYDYEPPKLKYCVFPKELLKDRKFCKKQSIIIDVLQVSVLQFNRPIFPLLNLNEYERNLAENSFRFDKYKLFMLVASCYGKILYCKIYTNFDNIYNDTDKMFTKLCDDVSHNSSKFKKHIFILGPSLPISASFSDSNSTPFETLTSESLTSNDASVCAPRYESTRVENCQPRLQESFSHIGASYLIARGHSVIIGKFNTSPYLIPLFEVATYWKNFLESKLKQCKNFNKVLHDCEQTIRKSNFKKYFKNFPAIC